MNDKRVRRIDHSKCNHRDTAHAKRKCREQQLAATRGKTAPLRKSPHRTKTVAVKAPVPVTFNLDDLRSLIEGLDSVVSCAEAVCTIEVLQVVVDLDGGMRVAARYDGNAWTCEVKV